MNGLPWFRMFPRDFIEGTHGMPLETKGAYCIALHLIYLNGGHLPPDDAYIAGVMGCSVRKWRALAADLIARGKLVENPLGRTNLRALSELENVAKVSDKNAENRRGKNKTNELPITKGKGKPRTREPYTEPYTEKQEKSAPPGAGSLPVSTETEKKERGREGFGQYTPGGRLELPFEVGDVPKWEPPPVEPLDWQKDRVDKERANDIVKTIMGRAGQ